MLDQLRALAVFARVADLGSFRAAARALTLAPSVVSHHVAALERQVGAPLMYRTTRRLTLTPAGERLAAAARDMAAAAQRGLDDLAGASAAPAGELRVTAAAFLIEIGLCEHVAAFAAAHPAIHLRLVFDDRPHDLLRDGLDLALRAGAVADSSHRTRSLGRLRRALVAAPSYLAARSPIRTPDDLEGHAYLQLASRPPQVTLAHGGRTATRAFTPQLTVDSAGAIRRLACAGAGLATLPAPMIADDLAHDRLREVLPRWRLPELTLHAVWPASAQRAALTHRLVAFLAERLASA